VKDDLRKIPKLNGADRWRDFEVSRLNAARWIGTAKCRTEAGQRIEEVTSSGAVEYGLTSALSSIEIAHVAGLNETVEEAMGSAGGCRGPYRFQHRMPMTTGMNWQGTSAHRNSIASLASHGRQPAELLHQKRVLDQLRVPPSAGCASGLASWIRANCLERGYPPRYSSSEVGRYATLFRTQIKRKVFGRRSKACQGRATNRTGESALSTPPETCCAFTVATAARAGRPRLRIAAELRLPC